MGVRLWVVAAMLCVFLGACAGASSAGWAADNERMEPKVADLEARALKAAPPMPGELRVYASIAPGALNVTHMVSQKGLYLESVYSRSTIKAADVAAVVTVVQKDGKYQTEMEIWRWQGNRWWSVTELAEAKFHRNAGVIPANQVGVVIEEVRAGEQGTVVRVTLTNATDKLLRVSRFSLATQICRMQLTDPQGQTWKARETGVVLTRPPLLSDFETLVMPHGSVTQDVESFEGQTLVRAGDGKLWTAGRTRCRCNLTGTLEVADVALQESRTVEVKAEGEVDVMRAAGSRN